MERIATRVLPLALIGVLGHPLVTQQTYSSPERFSPASVTAISKQIRDLEYHFSMREDGSWTAPNRGNNLRSVVHSEGLEVVSRTEGADGFRVGLRLIGHGREGTLEPAPPVQPQAWQDRVELVRPGLTQWFVNRVDGLEHGFTVAWRPDGDATEPLVIDMALDTTLALRLTDEGRSVEFRKGGGLAVLRYANLAVYDAMQAHVPAFLSLRRDRLRIVIDDRGAAYPLTIDPLMNLPAWTYESDQANARFGWSVRGAGDVNGDGFDDVIVGANRFDNGEDNEGRVFVFHGSPSGLEEATPDWTAEGDRVDAEMGRSVSGAGDINGDGYHDVVIGSFRYDNVETDEGAIWVYLGSAAGLQDDPHLVLEGHLLGQPADGGPRQLGWQVRRAGDVNSDGFDDIIVGQRGYSNGEDGEGAAHLFLGSASGISATPDWTWETHQPVALVGSLGTAGDLNGDGFDDIVVGSPWYDNDDDAEGLLFIFHGSATGLGGAPDSTLEINVEGAQLSDQCAFTAGDVNGDGYDDLIAGAYPYANPDFLEGAAFAWYGSPSGVGGAPDWTLEGNQEDAWLGHCVSTAGDVNGDGYDDVIVGATWWDALFTNEGRALVFHGSAAGLSSPTSPDWSVTGLQEDARLGRRVSTAGDVNGDGYADVIVSANRYDNGETDEGRAYVYHGFCDGDDLDGDLRCDGALDCDDSDSSIWATPGEVVEVVFTGPTMLTWAEPPEAGATSVVYDTLRSTDASDFSAAACIDTNGADTQTGDGDEPAAGSTFFYLVRAENDCPAGDGSLGTTSEGVERMGPACPG